MLLYWLIFPMLAFQLNSLLNQMLSWGLAFFLSALVWPAGNNPGLHQETATAGKKRWKSVFLSQPVAWERSIGQSFPLAREKYQSNSLLYTNILLAGNSLNSGCCNRLTSTQGECQLKKGICAFKTPFFFLLSEENTFPKLLKTLNKYYPRACQRANERSHSKSQQTFPCRQPALFEGFVSSKWE